MRLGSWQEGWGARACYCLATGAARANMFRIVIYIGFATGLATVIISCVAQVSKTYTQIPSSQEPTGQLQIKLEILNSDTLNVRITNQTDKPVIFCPRVPFIVGYHESPNRKRTAITWDGSNAEFGLLSPIETVCLRPKATYSIRMAVFVDRQHGIDRRLVLKKKGVVFVVLNRLRASDFDTVFRKEAAKWSLLTKDASSNRIVTP